MKQCLYQQQQTLTSGAMALVNGPYFPNSCIMSYLCCSFGSVVLVVQDGTRNFEVVSMRPFWNINMFIKIE